MTLKTLICGVNNVSKKNPTNSNNSPCEMLLSELYIILVIFQGNLSS